MKMMKRQNLKMKMSFAVIKDMAGGVFYNYPYNQVTGCLSV